MCLTDLMKILFFLTSKPISKGGLIFACWAYLPAVTLISDALIPTYLLNKLYKNGRMIWNIYFIMIFNSNNSILCLSAAYRFKKNYLLHLRIFEKKIHVIHIIMYTIPRIIFTNIVLKGVYLCWSTNLPSTVSYIHLYKKYVKKVSWCNVILQRAHNKLFILEIVLACSAMQ